MARWYAMEVIQTLFVVSLATKVLKEKALYQASAFLIHHGLGMWHYVWVNVVIIYLFIYRFCLSHVHKLVANSPWVNTRYIQ